MPAARAAIGTSEWPVMPGMVFISSRKTLPSSRNIRSALPQPLQPSAATARMTIAWMSCSCAAGKPLGQWYFVSSLKYLFW